MLHTNAISTLFSIGFRIFFLLAAAYGIVSMVIWAFLYQGIQIAPVAGSIFHWHAHEMLYGYSMAVIAGFLLTAVQNWTGLATTTPKSLAFIVVMWLTARIALLFGSDVIILAFVADSLFLLSLNFAIIKPIIKAKNWVQMGIVSKLVLFFILNACYYLGVMGIVTNGETWGIWGGFFILFALILTMARRVFPFFISKGLALSSPLKNSKIADIVSIIAYVVFVIFELVWEHAEISAAAAFVIFASCAVRLVLWHHPGIWKKPLLWSLWLSYAAITGGFLLIAIAELTWFSSSVARHLLAIGGLGLVTLSMMARVSLGHTGRSIHEVPVLAIIGLVCMVLAALIRVPTIVLFPDYYTTWVLIAQILWIASFVLFLIPYSGILIKKKPQINML